jgi:hypothetical protein
VPIFGVHHDGKISPGWWGGGCTAHPPPFTLVTITYTVAVYAPAERADTLPVFHLCPLYVLCDRAHHIEYLVPFLQQPFSRKKCRQTSWFY